MQETVFGLNPFAAMTYVCGSGEDGDKPTAPLDVITSTSELCLPIGGPKTSMAGATG